MPEPSLKDLYASIDEYLNKHFIDFCYKYDKEEDVEHQPTDEEYWRLYKDRYNKSIINFHIHAKDITNNNIYKYSIYLQLYENKNMNILNLSYYWKGYIKMIENNIALSWNYSQIYDINLIFEDDIILYDCDNKIEKEKNIYFEY
jgi:hypothetical protein